VARTTEIDGRTYSANATEFNDHGEPVSRISLTVHQRDRQWALPAENSPYADHAFGIHGNVVNSLVCIDIGDLSVWLPEGHEHRVLDALSAAITEQARQAKAGTEDTVVHLTGTDYVAEALAKIDAEGLFPNTTEEVSA
jgi:hypothetical protein